MLTTRRKAGITNLHRIAVAVEVVLLWLALRHSGIGFTTLLPFYAYPLAITLGALVSISTAERHSATLVARLAEFKRPSHFHAIVLAFRQTAFIAGAIFTVVVVFKDPGISRFFLGVYFLCLVPFLTVINRFQPRLIGRRFLTHDNTIPTLLVGSAKSFPAFDEWLTNQTALGAHCLGQVTYRSRSARSDLPVLGDFAQLEEVVRQHRPTQLVMLEAPANPEDAALLLRVCLATGTRLDIHERLGYELGYPFVLSVDDVHSFLTLQDEPLEDPVNQALKRLLDIGVSLIVLVTLLPPVALLVWVMQLRQSPGPLFHAHTRSGANRSTFTIFKFRTMHDDHVSVDVPATTNDQRVFPFGRLLRRSSLDELPQFWNVLRGEMSTVGPRPHLVTHSRSFVREVDTYYLRYFAKPGITGLAQCNGLRGELLSPQQLRDRIHYDLHYIRNWTFWMDLWIMLKTARQIIFPPRSAQ